MPSKRVKSKQVIESSQLARISCLVDKICQKQRQTTRKLDGLELLLDRVSRALHEPEDFQVILWDPCQGLSEFLTHREPFCLPLQ